jgi:hypothetical protein
MTKPKQQLIAKAPIADTLIRRYRAFPRKTTASDTGDRRFGKLFLELGVTCRRTIK